MRNNKLQKLLSLFLLALFPTVFFSCSEDGKQYKEEDLKKFVKEFEKKLKPLDKQIKLAEFQAAISGSEADYKKAAKLNIKQTLLYSSKKDFKLISEIKKSGVIKDKLLKRELDILHNEFLFHQVNQEKISKMINLAKDVEKKFQTYRPKLDGEKLSDNEIEQVLTTSKDKKWLERVWKASKKVGSVVSNDIIRLVKMRNEAARSVGFKNYYEMRLKLKGQDPAEIAKLYEELEILTRGPYFGVKKELDKKLAAHYEIKVKELRPWHYQNRFFQEAPDIYQMKLDDFYKDQDVIEISKKFFKGMNLNIDDIIAKSSLEHTKGKSGYSFATDIDREGDVRILADVQNNYTWMKNILYESGFAVYLKNIDQKLPYLLRTSAHFCTNDGVATFFERFASDPNWIKSLLKNKKAEDKEFKDNTRKFLRLNKLIFSQWAQVMYRFEKALYEDPHQDLNALWWELVNKYQRIIPPANRTNPDWAAKAHFITLPCTYHNYMLGEMFASQLYSYLEANVIKKDVSGNIVNNKEVGKFLTEKVFKQGAKMSWNELIRTATGEELAPVYFKEQFVK